MNTIAKQLEEIAEEMCENYCKWPNQYIEEEHDGVPLCESDICAECPIYKLT